MQAQKQPSSKGMTWAFAILGGITIAAADESFAGLVIGIGLGIVIAQMLFLRNRARDLQQQLSELRALLATRSMLERDTSAARAEAKASESPIPIAQAARPGEPIAPVVTATPSTVSTTAPPPTRFDRPRRAAKPEPDIVDRLVKHAVAWLKRGNPLARIGIVVLFFGAVFLAKYAADHSLLPIELRFVALAVGAIALALVGWRLRKQRPAYAEILQGGGIAGLYLTVFAAASLYRLLPLTLAFALMVGIALAAAILAVAQNALSLAVIGTAGGFLAPILVSSGSGNHVALFSYYAILNLGICAVAWFRTWRVLNVLGFVFTFTITGLWRASGYTPDELLSADFFLILFFLMYVGVSILNCVRQPPDLKGYVSGSLVFGLPVVAFTLHATLVARIEYAMAWSALASGAFYLVLAFALLRSGRDSFRLLVESFAALGIVFASLAIPLAFDTRTTAAMWAVEGAGLVWLGVRQQRKLARAFGALLQAAGGLGFLVGLRYDAQATALLNTAYLGAAMLAVAGLFTGYRLFRNQDRQAAYERGASPAFALWGVAWWTYGGLREIERLIPDWALGAALIYVAVTCAALTLIGARFAWPMARRTALYLPAAFLLFAVPASFAAGHPFGWGGAPGWLAVFAVFYWMLQRMDREALPAPALVALHAGAAWLLVVLAAWEAAWQIDRVTAGVWPLLPWGVVPAAALASLSRRTLIPQWPIARHAPIYRVLIAGPIAVAIALWITLVNAVSIGDPIWLPYLPLLNPLDIAVAVCLASGALWWTALDAEQQAKVWPADGRILIAIVAALVFWWLNAALLRALHHDFDAPITLHGMARSQFVQAALSIFWAVLGFAAMTLAARKHWRYVWIVGAALMLIVVAKLFLVDLSNAGTIARIISFLTIGALIVITGYLAPLPPKRTDATCDAEPPSEETVTS